MFTGIVEEVGIVRETTQKRMAIQAEEVIKDLGIGDSMCVNGVCLTVTSIAGGRFFVDVMPETLRRSNLGKLHGGDSVNLERGLAVGGRMGGHFVQGHVDDLGKVVSIVPEGGAEVMRVSMPFRLARYIVEKGFIAVDGVSLTVVDLDDSRFSVSLVEYTRQTTTLGTRRSGDIVNLEVDIIAKYVQRLSRPGGTGVTAEFLARY